LYCYLYYLILAGIARDLHDSVMTAEGARWLTMADDVESLVQRFGRMVSRDGGSLALLSRDGDEVRVGYRPGVADPDCADGVCVLPDRELEALMTETFARHDPRLRVRVELVP
jgi:hypothetical protein